MGVIEAILPSKSRRNNTMITGHYFSVKQISDVRCEVSFHYAGGGSVDTFTTNMTYISMHYELAAVFDKFVNERRINGVGKFEDGSIFRGRGTFIKGAFKQMGGIEKMYAVKG